MSSYSSSNLNSRQREALHYIDGPLLVLAGAGSGKTRVITQKIIYLIKQCGYDPQHLYAVTFTNKAAKEMKSRIARSLDKQNAKALNISTFHTLGLKIIRRESKRLGFKKNITIYDTQDCQSLLKQLADKPLLKAVNVEAIQQRISLWKNALLGTQDVLTQPPTSEWDQQIAALYERYDMQLGIYNAVDFDDLIRLPVKLLSSDEEARGTWQRQVRYLLVDEYQDTNACQYALVQLLVGDKGGLTVVGDDDQSIYSWRGAQPQNLTLLKKDYPQLKVIKLEQNYRSTNNILGAANNLISHNAHEYEKKLWSKFGMGDPLQIMEARDETHEAERVVSAILHNTFQGQGGYRDYAILYRGNYQSRLFERCLREHKIPYYLTGGTSFFALTEIKDVMSYMRLMVNDDDDQAFIRVINTPRREIGPTTLAAVAQYAAQHHMSFCEACTQPALQAQFKERTNKRLRLFVEFMAHIADCAKRGDPIAAVRDLLDEIAYKAWLEDTCRDMDLVERKWENLMELIDWMTQLNNNSVKELSLAELLQQMTLMDILDRDDKERTADCVHLMTIHAAKGLEFPHVFIVGMEENILPHYAGIESDNIEEERRLAYVAMTRAQQTLTLSYAAKRKRNGEMIATEPSRFLNELPQDNVRWAKPSEQSSEERQQKGRAHLENLRGILN